MTGGWRAALALLGLYGVLVVVLAYSVDRTADESTYLMAGRAILNVGWEHPFTRLHGPLPFLANQLFTSDLVVESLNQRLPFDSIARGRLGLVPCGLLSGALVFVCSRRLFGVRGGLLSLALFVLNPLMLGYGALLAVDMAYTAGMLLALWLAARFIERPSAPRGLAVGAGLGVACATKYLALFSVPLVLAAVAFGAARRSSGAQRIGRALLGVVGVALTAWVTLHASYGFSVGTAPTDSGVYASDAIASLVETPVVGSVVGLLPEPYLVGADYQLSVGGGRHRPYLEGEFAPGHGDYYLWVFLRKTPEWVLALFLGVALAWLARGARARTDAGKVALALALPTAAVLLVYLSFLTRLQLGVRYVLPLYPMAFIACGAAAEPLLRRRVAAWALGAVALISTAFDTATQWPNLIAYFNVSSGGQRDAWRHFADSNAAWGQLFRRGQDVLAEREGEDWVWLTSGEGPRFGRLAIYIVELCQVDPEDRGVSRHWLHAFEPVDHVGASWWVFDVTREDWERRLRSGAVKGAELDRERAEFALALAGAGHLEQARKEVHQLPPERAEPLVRLLATLEREDVLSVDGVFDLAQQWMVLGRPDRAEQLLREHPAVGSDPRRDQRLALALVRQRRTQEAIGLLNAGDLSGRTSDVLLLVSLYREALEWASALEALDRWAPTLDPEAHELVRTARERVAGELESQRAFMRLVVGG